MSLQASYMSNPEYSRSMGLATYADLHLSRENWLDLTLQEEYTPSFSSFFGRGEEQSCAFFTAILSDPAVAPEHSVPPAPGAAGVEPAAPTAGEPCCVPVLSDILESDPRTGIPSRKRQMPLSIPQLWDQTWRSSLFFMCHCKPIVPPLGEDKMDIALWFKGVTKMQPFVGRISRSNAIR